MLIMQRKRKLKQQPELLRDIKQILSTEIEGYSTKKIFMLERRKVAALISSHFLL